jgi:hypothetical protein
MRTLVGSAALVCGLVFLPVTALADGDDTAATGPTLSCSLVGVHILMDDVNAARLVCRVVGAPDGDSNFTVSATGALQPLCDDGLAGGEGTCRGRLVDSSIPLSLTATLQPSGLTIGPVSIRGSGSASAAPSNAPPMQFFPLGD